LQPVWAASGQTCARSLCPEINRQMKPMSLWDAHADVNAVPRRATRSLPQRTKHSTAALGGTEDAKRKARDSCRLAAGGERFVRLQMPEATPRIGVCRKKDRSCVLP